MGVIINKISVILSIMCIILFTSSPVFAFWGQIVNPITHQIEKQATKGIAKQTTQKGVKHTIGGNSRILAKNMGNVPKGWQAHHIIPVECKTHPVLNKIGFDMDDPINGIALPSRPQMDPTLPVHRGYHADYSRAVKRELDEIPLDLSEEETRKRVLKVISKFRKKIESGQSLYNTEGVPNGWK